MPLTLSVITATYNQAQYIAQTIESILSQEGDFCIDYIIVDDGSTDNTREIIEKYDQLLKNNQWPVKCKGVSYRYWTRQNGGFSGAMNEGFRAMKGYAVTWLNSDDYFMPGALHAIAETFAAKPDIDLIYTDCLKVFEGKSKPPTIEPRPRSEESLESLRTRGNSFAMSFFTKRIIDRIGLLDESLQYCVDLDFWFRMYGAGARSFYLPITLGAFRIWPGSKTSTKQGLFREERKIIAKRYGGNRVPQHKIYKFRKKFESLFNLVQKKMPGLYALLKKALYRCIDLFHYNTKT